MSVSRLKSGSTAAAAAAAAAAAVAAAVHQSGCYNHSIRLAKRYGLDAELMSFALKSRESLMVDCAKYFEEKEEFEKAVQLYHKVGSWAGEGRTRIQASASLHGLRFLSE